MKSKTKVALLVERKLPKLSRKLTNVLKEHGKRIASRVAKLYKEGVHKGDVPGHEFYGNQYVPGWGDIKAGQKIILYRGENDQNKNGKWWTTDRKQAEGYGRIKRVILSAEDIFAHARGYGGKHEFVFEGETPEEIAATKKIAKMVESEYVQRILDELDAYGVAVDLVDSITPELIRTYTEAGLFGIGQIGINITKDMTIHMDQAAFDYADAHGGELITDLAGTTIEDLRDVITNAIEQGMSSADLSDDIEEMGAFGEARADAIARTELANAHVQGNVEGWREAGSVVGKKSILGDNHEIEDECDECAAAGAVPMDEDFIPGYSFPPYHPNCVCDIVPVLEGE